MLLPEHPGEPLSHPRPQQGRPILPPHLTPTRSVARLRAFEGLPFIMKNSIKVVRSPSYNVDFVPPKDVALPQVLQPFALLEGAKDVEGCSYLSDYHDLPFNDVLDWRKFAVVLKERDVYELKCILKSISCEEFVALHKSSSSGMMHSTLLYINWRCGIM